ncbi:MAG: serine/threonine-protein kinase [Armatimonadia bacterium]
MGRGGMGTVYEATQDSPRRPVALKVLPTELARDPKVAERFAREANRLAALEEHPGIAKVYASGEESGVAYLAMQLLTGGDLEARLQSHGRLPWQEAATIGAAVADALHFAHEQGIVHRDVKPANIMFTGQGQPVVTDFGIAQAADEVRMTMTGTSICTPEYASPEQIKGNPLDGRSDLYSLGVVLYRMVCGQPLFDCPSPISWAMKHVSEAPPSPRLACPDLPLAFEAIIVRCLAKEPHERFATGADLARALREVQAAPAATVAAPAPFRPAPPPPAATTVVTAPARARFGWAVVALIVIGALALGAGGMALVNMPSVRAPRSGPLPAAPPVPVSPPAMATSPVELTTDEVTSFLMERWLVAQNSRDFDSYKSCYTNSFVGIKRTRSGGKDHYGYASWLADRRKMFKPGLRVDITIEDISGLGEERKVVVEQTFRTPRYADRGTKIFHISKTVNGPKIVYEEMLDAKRIP